MSDDLISRQAVIDLWEKYHPAIAVDAMQYDAELRRLPSAERDYKFDEVVSCKECKWWDHDEDRSDGRHRCELLDNIRFEPEFYCAYGEREEE